MLHLKKTIRIVVCSTRQTRHHVCTSHVTYRYTFLCKTKWFSGWKALIFCNAIDLGLRKLHLVYPSHNTISPILVSTSTLNHCMDTPSIMLSCQIVQDKAVLLFPIYKMNGALICGIHITNYSQCHYMYWIKNSDWDWRQYMNRLKLTSNHI